MSDCGAAVVFLCGPRAGGNSDAAGLAFAAGLARAGRESRIIRLREYSIASCRGCGACGLPGRRRCPLDRDDDAAEWLFDTIKTASVLAFAAPIYFYHVPALFKAFIDRAQRHYEARTGGDPSYAALSERRARVMLVAGRQQGERLFDGALLTLKYFLWPFHVSLAEPCVWPH